MNKSIFLIIISLSIVGCSNRHETEKYQYDRKNIIHVKANIKEIVIDSIMLSSHTSPFIIDDYLLLADYRSYNQQIHLFDKSSFRHVASTAYFGQGPDEITRMGELGMDDVNRKFEVMDFGKNTIFSYDLDSVLANPEYTPNEKLKIKGDKILVNYQYINDSICIGLFLEPMGNSNYTSTVAIQNRNNGEIKKMPYTHPEIKNKHVNFVASMEHEIYVECYVWQNLMTICSLDGKLKYNVYGSSDWKENKKGQHLYYQQVAFVNDKIYALYLNDNSIREDSAKGQVGNDATKFLIFDLNGDYIATLETGYRIMNFCYDKGNNRIIMSLNDEIQFAYFDLTGLF